MTHRTAEIREMLQRQIAAVTNLPNAAGRAVGAERLDQ
jgi:elongation factor P--beta-lysine ligase